MAKLISGKIVSVKVRNEVKKETEELRENHGIVPGLAVILVGNDPASQVYVRNKQLYQNAVDLVIFVQNTNQIY